MTRLSCQRPDSEASLEVVPVFANGPTGLVSITIDLPPSDHLTVHVDAAAFADSLRRALGEPWRCSHSPRCADSACSDNPAIQRWTRGER